MYLIQFTISSLPYLLPAIILAVIPNTKKALITALTLFALVYAGPTKFILGIGYSFASITQLHSLIACFYIFIPAILAKTFAIRAKNSGKDQLAVILPFVGLIVPIILLVSNEIQYAHLKKKYSISDECKSNGLKPIMSGVHFNLKPFDIFEFRQSKMRIPRKHGFLCDETDEGRNAFEADSISYRFPTERIRKSGYCSEDGEGWVKLACHMDDNLPKNKHYNSTIVIFKKGVPSSLHTGGLGKLHVGGFARMNYDSTYQYYIGSKNKFNKVGKYEGFYTREDLGEYIWISPDPSMKSPDGNPYATSCSDVDGGCITTYPLNDEIVLRYSFASGHPKNMVLRTKHVDNIITQIVNEWRGIYDNKK